MKNYMATLCFVLFAASSVFASEMGSSGLHAGEYTRDGYNCKTVVAQENDVILIQVFSTEGKTCRENGKKITCTLVKGTTNIYFNNSLNAYIRSIGDDAFIAAHSLNEAKKMVGNLYVRH